MTDTIDDNAPATTRPRFAPRKKRRPHIRPNARNEAHDVFKRINMHGGDTDVCWEWLGSHNVGTRGERRGRIVIAGEEYYVHRVVYELYTGHKLKPGEVVRHKCDHCWCANPTHLIVGTQLDNVHDMLERERVGMKMVHVKRIMQMLEIGCPTAYISSYMRQHHDVQLEESVIRRIRLRRIYKHIPWEWGDAYAASRKQKEVQSTAKSA